MSVTFDYGVSNYTEKALVETLNDLVQHVENEVVEFKLASNNFDLHKLGQYFSAISNEANLRNKKYGWLIVEAQNIVKERYMEADISLDEVCAVLGVSNSYFSSVFKKEAGKSFISYLTDYRMDIAAEMILNTDEKSYTIAEKVGYLDANYFSYVFKKKFGVSPSKYRASVK